MAATESGCGVEAIRRRLAATGIGYAGIEGAWWLPALEPFRLPAAARATLEQTGAALFLLFDSVAALYGTKQGRDGGLDALLSWRVPRRLLEFQSRRPVLSFRPDFQIVAGEGSSRPRFRATELEIAPSAQGFAHAMQVAHGLDRDLAREMAKSLEGRTLLFLGTEQWSEFLFEQMAFCRALEEQGARGRVLYDRPLATLDGEAQRGERWRPPLFGVPHTPPSWNPRILERIEAAGLARFWAWDVETWPALLSECVLFRFGYVNCFSPQVVRIMLGWEAAGNPFLNPPWFVLDSKVLLVAARLPVVQRWIAERDPVAVDILSDVIPETVLLTPASAGRVERERSHWVIKLAGFDDGNQAWGGRSLRVGAQHGAEAWRAALEAALAQSLPVVAQRLTPSVRMSSHYLAADGSEGTLDEGASRLRVFFVRKGEHDAAACGAHITLSETAMQVSESVGAVQGAVVYDL